jgi:hypothetical protein
MILFKRLISRRLLIVGLLGIGMGLYVLVHLPLHGVVTWPFPLQLPKAHCVFPSPLTLFSSNTTFFLTSNAFLHSEIGQNILQYRSNDTRFAVVTAFHFRPDDSDFLMERLTRFGFCCDHSMFVIIVVAAFSSCA